MNTIPYRHNIRDLFLQNVEMGNISYDEALLMCVKWMGRDDIEQMLKANEVELVDEYHEEPEEWQSW